MQAENEVDDNWTLIRAGAPGAPQDWIEWLVVCVSRSIFKLFRLNHSLGACQRLKNWH